MGRKERVSPRMSMALFPLVSACSHRAHSRGCGVSSGRDTRSGDGFAFLGHPASASASTVDSTGTSFTAVVHDYS